MEICGKLFGPGLMRRDPAAGVPRGSLEMSACSACAGDYEDPDRTVWVNDRTDLEDTGATRAEEDEFPAES